MQQPPPMMNMMPPFPPNSITTEQIQKYLDENKTLILAILDNQNLGKLTECAQYQAQLQKNLMYLAAIADAQPPAPTIPSQMPPHPAMQQGGHYMQHPQLVASQQPGGFLPKSPLQFTPQQMQEQQRQQLQHQQTLQNHMGIRPGVNNGLQGMHSEGHHLGGNSASVPSTTGGLTGLPDFSRGGAGHGSGPSVSAGAGSGAGAGSSNSPLDARDGKQDGAEAGIGEGQANSGGNNNANSELSQKKGSEDGK